MIEWIVATLHTSMRDLSVLQWLFVMFVMAAMISFGLALGELRDRMRRRHSG